MTGTAAAIDTGGIIPPAKYFTPLLEQVVLGGLEVHPSGPVSQGPGRLFIFQKGSFSPLVAFSYLARTGIFPVLSQVDALTVVSSLDSYMADVPFSDEGPIHFWESSLSDTELATVLRDYMADSGVSDSSMPVVVGLSADSPVSVPSSVLRIDAEALPSVFTPSVASSGVSWTPAGWPGVPDDGVEGKAALFLHWGWLYLVSSHWFENLMFRIEASDGIDSDNLWKNILLCCGRYGWDDPRLMSERLGFEIPRYLVALAGWDSILAHLGVVQAPDMMVCGAVFRGLMRGTLPCYFPDQLSGEDQFRFRGFCADFVIPDREYAHVY